MSTLDLSLFVLIQLIGGLITGVTSFGGGLFAIPLMTLFMPIQQAIVIACFSFGFAIVLMIFIYRKHLLWREIFILGIAGIPAAPLGTWLLANSDMRFLLIAASCAIFLFLLWQWTMPRLSKKDITLPVWSAWPCGFFGGFMSATVGMGGPPIVFYTYMRHWNKESAIGGVSAACGIQLLMIFFGQWLEGFYTPAVIKLSVIAAVGQCMGLVLAVPLVKRINVLFFRNLVLAMLVLSAFTLFIKGITP